MVVPIASFAIFYPNFRLKSMLILNGPAGDTNKCKTGNL